MSVAGFDIGDQASCVAVARKRGIDVLLNKESKRETPSVVAFGPKQRQMGTDAVGSLNISPKNAVTNLKLLLGKKFSSPQVQKNIASLPFACRQGPEDSILIDVQYLNEKTTFTPEQLVAMLIVDNKSIAENDGSPVTDCVLSVPIYYTEAERHAMLAAARIANVNCLRLLHETTAVALAYGIYKTDLPETNPHIIAFVDIGASSLQVSIVAFKKGQLQVLSHAWDREVGGRLFDEALFDHFCKEFGDKHKINIRSNARASYRLRTACEKMKKVLSANAQASLSVESIMEDVDVRGSMSRDDFEALCAPVLQRVKAPLQQALDEAKVGPADLAAVELVGSSSRVPSLLAILKEVLGQEPSRTQNAKEAVSKGCALCCAMLSPIFRVRDFQVIDASPFGYAFTWEKEGAATTSTLFERGSSFPNSKVLTLTRGQAFDIQAAYTDDSPIPAGFARQLGRFDIKPPSAEGPVKLKLKLRLNLNCCTSLESAQYVSEEEYEEKVPKAAPAAPAAKEAKDVSGDTPMAEARTTADGDVAQGVDTPMAEATANGTAASDEGGAAPMEAEASPPPAPKEEVPQFEMVKKKRSRLNSVPFQSSAPLGSLPAKDMQVLIEKENELAAQSRQQEATNDRKNALEAYVYALRSKLSGPLEPFVTEDNKTSILAELDKMEDWLYEEGEDETKSVYVQQLERLQKLGSPIEFRAAESVARAPAAQALHNTADHYLSIVRGSDAKYSHLSAEDRSKVEKECEQALSWLREKVGLQEQLRATEDPVLTHTDINKKNETLSRVCHPITSKPRPASPKKEKKAKSEAAPAAAEAAPEPQQEAEQAGDVPAASAAAQAEADGMQE